MVRHDCITPYPFLRVFTTNFPLRDGQFVSAAGLQPSHRRIRMAIHNTLSFPGTGATLLPVFIDIKRNKI